MNVVVKKKKKRKKAAALLNAHKFIILVLIHVKLLNRSLDLFSRRPRPPTVGNKSIEQ